MLRIGCRDHQRTSTMQAARLQSVNDQSDERCAAGIVGMIYRVPLAFNSNQFE
jgi:hypothetical protein